MVYYYGPGYGWGWGIVMGVIWLLFAICAISAIVSRPESSSLMPDSNRVILLPMIFNPRSNSNVTWINIDCGFYCHRRPSDYRNTSFSYLWPPKSAHE